MNEPHRFSFQVEALVPNAPDERRAVEWVQNFFDYFHPSLEAKVSINGVPVVTGQTKTPPSDDDLLQ